MMFLSALLWPALGVLGWTLYCSFCLARNYLVARKIGVPLRVIPIDHINPLWMLVDRKVLSLVRRLPGVLGDNSFTRYNYRVWEMQDRCRSHQEMGGVFMMVTPGRNWLYIADPDALMDMFRRRTDFPQCIDLTEMLNVFGTNLGTVSRDINPLGPGPTLHRVPTDALVQVEGQQWKTQRKMIATCFNEPNNEIVWSESLSLARDMLKYWAKKGSISSSADDLRTLSLHVLAGAGFGKSFKFEGHDERKSTSLSGDYKTSLRMCIPCALTLFTRETLKYQHITSFTTD